MLFLKRPSGVLRFYLISDLSLSHSRNTYYIKELTTNSPQDCPPLFRKDERERIEEEYRNDDAYLFDSLSWPCPREDLV
ncbi:hypothetical protein TSUD_335870 [Trifolium subterraneum]|uniref:Uncharacterized protein n=1 Tax=Trifolium subterraneum TaxID=3900 RepID=A0A2Z6LS53_TRISU|nr:hypothetical protein TSUD_335870 [Trifolium subterraneum]